jgi:hypothetical protein
MTLEMRKTKKRTLEMREEDKEEDIGDEGDKQKNPLTKQEGIKKTGPLLCILMKE